MHDTVDFKGIAAAALACSRSLLPSYSPRRRAASRQGEQVDAVIVQAELASGEPR
jgi:hypothetical protein